MGVCFVVVRALYCITLMLYAIIYCIVNKSTHYAILGLGYVHTYIHYYTFTINIFWHCDCMIYNLFLINF